MEIAIVGGGIFGVHCANALAECGCDVTIFEKQDRLMGAASQVNQWRLHKGFHYPRSRSTSVSCRDSQRVFREVYQEAVIENDEHYYCIASEKTKTTPEEFLEHCDALDLGYERTTLDLVRQDNIDLCVKVDEDRINPDVLRTLVEQRLKKNRVEVQYNTHIDSVKELSEFDYVIVATYANSNGLVQDYPSLQHEYKYELCEKPVVTLPEAFHGKSLVIMDGPFMCFDPYQAGSKFLLGNVVHAIHDTHIGETPVFDDRFKPLLNNGVITDPEITNIDLFRQHGAEYVPGLADAEHIGSMYTLRTTLPNKEETDARPTIVEREDNVFRVFSGKISTCVEAANSIMERIEAENGGFRA